MDPLLQAVIEAHGGLDRWAKVRAIDATFNFWGDVLVLKGYPGRRQPTFTIDASEPRTVIQRLDGDPDRRWMFTPDRVWIEERDGLVVEERLHPRAAFKGHERKTPWDHLHLLYFIGYSMWNYFTAPFLFAGPGFSSREIESHREGLETWRVLEVTYPDHLPYHSKVQKLYFDNELMLKRLDYVAEVLGGVAAHYCFDPVSVDGLIFPSLRRVVRRNDDGPLLSGKTSFLQDFGEIVVRNR